MEISCAFPTTLDSPEWVKVAEDLGYDRAWLYYTPRAESGRVDVAGVGRRANRTDWARPRRALSRPCAIRWSTLPPLRALVAMGTGPAS